MSEAWKARLLPPSFRGIPFFIDNHTLTGGRHAESHEPPDRDKNFSEDSGRKGKTFSISGHILGDNYFFLRDALLKAFEQQGPGVLVHPYVGIKSVQVDSFSINEDTTQGRIAFFNATFIEAGEASFPFSALDAVTDFFVTVSATIAQIKNAYQLAVSFSELPAFAREGFELQIADFTNTIDNGFANVRLDSEKHAELKRKNDEAANSTATLTSNPATNAQVTDEIIEGLKDLVPDAPDNQTIDTTAGRDDKLDVFNSLLIFGDDNEALPETTPTRRQEKTNALAFTDMVQQLAIVRLAEQVVSKDFNSNNEAVGTRNLVSENITKQLEKERISDEVFQALEDLNAKLVIATPNVNSSLANEKSISLNVEKPSLVLTYDLYQSPDRERDILDRNAVRNPAFLVGDLNVLSN